MKIYQGAKLRSHAIYLLISTVAIIATLPSSTKAAPPPGYTLSWADEFNEPVGTQPSSNDWNWETGMNSSYNELETYVADEALSHIIADASATDGYALQIQASDDNGRVGTAVKYSSARMNSAGKQELQYGFK